MADIFISYASEDRPRAETLAKALEELGWSVWWDRTIPPGKAFDQVIEEAINAARCVVVLWSKKSVKSDWVKEEANIGKERNILVPLKIDHVDLPLGFGRIQAADLTEWEAEIDHPGFTTLLGAISEIVGSSRLKIKKAEEKRAEEERRQRQELEPKLREEEQRKADEKRKRKEVKADIRLDKPESDLTSLAEPRNSEPIDSEPRKKRNAVIFGLLAGVAVLLLAGIWWWFSQKRQQEPIPIAERDVITEIFVQKGGECPSDYHGVRKDLKASESDQHCSDVNEGIGGDTVGICAKMEKLPTSSSKKVLTGIKVSHWINWKSVCPPGFEQAHGNNNGRLTTSTKGSCWRQGLCVRWTPLNKIENYKELDFMYVSDLYLKFSGHSAQSVGPRWQKAGEDIHAECGGKYVYLHALYSDLRVTQ